MQADARLSALQLSMVNTFCWKDKKEAVKPVSPELLDPEPNPEGCTDLLSLVKCLVIIECQSQMQYALKQDCVRLSSLSIHCHMSQAS